MSHRGLPGRAPWQPVSRTELGTSPILDSKVADFNTLLLLGPPTKLLVSVIRSSTLEALISASKRSLGPSGSVMPLRTHQCFQSDTGAPAAECGGQRLTVALQSARNERG
eukprot:730808-Hanusia_phi.AAC.1